MKTRFLVIPLLLALPPSLMGCSTPTWVRSIQEQPPSWLTPYRTDVSQGNLISESMAAQLKKGMTRDQVRAILGTPLLVDPFRANRWDYVFDFRRGDGARERRRFSVQFESDLLTSWGGDALPAKGSETVMPSKTTR
jgi:outer membrane protein assembly factor BamE